MARRPLPAVLLTVVLVATGLSVGSVPGSAPVDPGVDWRAALAERTDELESPPVEAARSAPKPAERPSPAPAATGLPEPEVAEVRLADRPRRAGATQVAVAAGARSAVGRTLRVEVLDPRAAGRAGLSGFAFRLSGPEGADLGKEPLPLRISVDYRSFAERFGGGYADRLRLEVVPACALAERNSDGCTGDRAIPFRNDRRGQQLGAELDDLTELGSTSVVFGVTAAPEGEEGSFKATPLALSGDWQVNTGSGEFSYRYQVPLSPAPAGPTPDVTLAYSSGAVDGLVSGRNTQGGQVGVGWGDLADSFVERRYNSCQADGQGYADLCWKSENATISLDGKASELVAVPGSNPRQWRLRDDSRWKVEQLTGASNGDDNGEHWKVTTPNGVQFFFGLGVNPDVGVVTNSAWTVPVFGDDAGEPCSTNTPLAWCQQAWRWNLDLVIDPHDNVQQFEYVKETNHYAALNGWPGFEHTEYVRSGALLRIKYGKRRVETTPAAEVDFYSDHRCLTLDHACPAPTAATASDYPDVPVDLMCFTAVCSQHTPTFFSTLRYSEIQTQVNNGDDDGPVAKVDQVRLYHGLPDPDPTRTGDRKLFLNSVQRTGQTAEDWISLPPVTFDPVKLDNRVDTAGELSPMPHYRVGVVTNEYGGQTRVTYGQPHPCPSPIPSQPNWDLNTRDCFPHWHAPEGAAPGFAIFHKYLVTSIEERDPLGGGPTKVTGYRYGDQVASGLPNAAWHHDRDEFAPNTVQSWSEWRGYADVLITQGDTRTRYRLFRGMNSDRLAGDPFPGPGSRVATVSSLDGTVTGTPDQNWLAGRVLDEQLLRTNGTVDSGVVHGYHAARTVDLTTSPDPLDDAWLVLENDAVNRLRDPATGNFVRRRTQTVYNAILGTPDTVIEHGWTATTGDERCTVTVPAFNVNTWLLDLPASVTRYANAGCTGAEVTRVEYAYDGGAFGAAPTRGDQTGKRDKITAAPTWATTTSTFDRLGRPLAVTDPNGHTTSTVYTPDVRYPRRTTVTNHLNHVQVTDWSRPRQVPLAAIDARGKRTTFGYDALGRVLTVHRPTEQQTGSPATFRFGYDIDPDKAEVPVVRTRQLQDGTRYVDSWVVHDSLGRERQTHRMSPESGSVIVTDTTYDVRGLAAAKSKPQAVSGTAGAGILPTPAGGWANTTTTTYDEQRRPVWTINRVNGAYRSSVITDYTHDTSRTTPDPPNGGVVRATRDAYDRTVRMEELDGAVWRPTRYGYDAADRPTTVTDPANNTITNTYDLAGRKIAGADPNMGSWTYAFDAAGNQTRSTSAAGVQLHTAYDALNRKTELRRDSASGPLLAKWEYDASGETGLLNRSTRFDPTGNWVDDVTGYDDRSRPTGRKLTVPAAVTGLAGDYLLGYGYDAADHRTSVTYPPVGGLPAETVTTTYNAIGLPETLVGAAEYVWGTAYDNRARPSWLLSGSRTVPFNRVFDYDADQRLARLRGNGGSTTLQDIRFTYDVTLGTLTEREVTLSGQYARECYGHDDRQRLTHAFTTTGTCATGTPGTGANPYNHTYEYSVDGNLTRRVEGTTPVGYTYPPAGSARPHAPTAVGGSSYTWTANGDLATRTVGGQTETLSWDAERRLTMIDDPDGDSTFVYDVEGARLLRQTPAGATLYLEGHEITKPAAGQVTAVRTYAFDGSATAVRTTAGVEYLATDNQGSVQLTVPTGATSASRTRGYQPYGKPRTTDVTASDRGWISQVEDRTTGLNYLNARYYDPTMGRFISPDPLFDPAVPQSVNPYSYGINNPVTFSDPSGLDPPCFHPGVSCTDEDRAGQIAGISNKGKRANAVPRGTEGSSVGNESPVQIGPGQVADFIDAHAGWLEKRAWRNAVDQAWRVDIETTTTIVVKMGDRTLILVARERQSTRIFLLNMRAVGVARLTGGISRAASKVGVAFGLAEVGLAIREGWNSTQGQDISVRLEQAVEEGGRKGAGVATGMFFAIEGAKFCSPSGAIGSAICAVGGGLVGGLVGEKAFDVVNDAADEGLSRYQEWKEDLFRCTYMSACG